MLKEEEIKKKKTKKKNHSEFRQGRRLGGNYTELLLRNYFRKGSHKSHL
jgi:hypothetical protein